MTVKIAVLAACASLLLLSCGSGVATDPAPAAAPPAADSLAPDRSGWLGRWAGPEGTYMVIATSDGAYSVTVSNLDGPRTFAATPTEDGLAFERDGLRESIRATDGAGTGMKWLQTKSDCLVVRQGEGFCRDPT